MLLLAAWPACGVAWPLDRRLVTSWLTADRMKSRISRLFVFRFWARLAALLAALAFGPGGLLPAHDLADGLRLVAPEACEELCLPELVWQADRRPWERSGLALWADRLRPGPGSLRAAGLWACGLGAGFA